MRRILFYWSLFFVTGIAAYGQSIYHFKYHLKNGADTTFYDAFFINKDDGNGTVRIKFKSPLNGETMLLHMDMQEEYPELGPGDLNYDKFDYRLSAPGFVKGNNTTNYTVPFFWFKKTPVSGIFEPWGVTAGIADPDKNINVFELVEPIQLKSLTKEFVADYFIPNDTLYNNLFITKTRALTPVEQSTKLVMIIVANINDPSIGSSCMLDRQRVSGIFRKLTGLLGIRLDSVIISGPNYNKKNVDKALDSVKPSPNDILVFYFSGHGFRKPKDSRRYPYIDLRSKVDGTYMVNSLNVEDIYTQLKKKKARFTWVITDCCNTNVESLNAEGAPPPKTKALGIDWSLENARSLFLDPEPLSILTTAADVDQKASSNNQFGGFYSFYINQAIESQLSYFSKKVSWENLLDNVKAQTINKAQHTYCSKPYIPENICDQVPVSQIARGN